MNIAREILEKHLNKDLDIKTYLKGSALTYKVVLDAMEEAINYKRCSTELPCSDDHNKQIVNLIDELYKEDDYTNRRNYINGYKDCFRFIQDFMKRKQDKAIT